MKRNVKSYIKDYMDDLDKKLSIQVLPGPGQPGGVTSTIELIVMVGIDFRVSEAVRFKSSSRLWRGE